MKKHLCGWMIALSACGFATSGAIAADGSSDGAGVLFDRLDANQDGVLTAAEIPADKLPLFERLLRSSDSDKSGSLSPAEELIAGLKSQRSQRELEAKATAPEGGPAGLPDPEQLFKRLDANGDGKVTADEAPDQARERFDQLVIRADKDNDGALSRQELIDGINSFAADIKAAYARGKTPAGVFEYLDANGDDKVVLDEVPEDRREGFARLLKAFDKNQDGGLNEDEFVAALNVVKLFGLGPAGNKKNETPSAGSETSSASGESKPTEKPAGAKAARLAKRKERGLDADHMTARLMKGDKNGDGRLSRDEVPDLLAKRFEKVDANGDGQLEESEVHAAAEKLKTLGKLKESN